MKPRTRHRVRPSFSFLTLSLLAGCMVGPNYEKPEINTSGNFLENRPDTLLVSDENLVEWWKQFQDETLNAYITEAVTKNFDLKIAYEKIAQARAQYQIQGAYLWPTINLTASAIRQRFSQTMFTSAASAESFASGATTSGIGAGIGPPVQNLFQVGFDALWELDFWGKFRRAKQAAFAEWEAQEFLADNVLLSVISEVARHYFTIRALHQQIDILQKKISAEETKVHLTTILFDAGLDSMLQLQEQMALLERDKAELPLLQTAYKQMIYAFAVLLGQQPETFGQVFTVAAPLPTFHGKVPAGLPSDLLRRRPDIRAAERSLAAATEHIGVAISALFPSIALTGNNVGYESSKASKWISHPSLIWGIGPSINWDLIDFGKTRGEIALARATQQEALLKYEQTVISALQDVEGALVAYFEEQKRNCDFSAMVDSYTEILSFTQDKLHAGLVSALAEIDASISLYSAQISLIQSTQALSSDLIALYKALGGSWICSSTP